MQLTNIFTVAFLLVGTAFAAPNEKPTKPTKPNQPIVVQQANQCGNDVSPFCCTSDKDGSYSNCKAISKKYSLWPHSFAQGSLDLYSSPYFIYWFANMFSTEGSGQCNTVIVCCNNIGVCLTAFHFITSLIPVSEQQQVCCLSGLGEPSGPHKMEEGGNCHGEDWAQTI